MATTALFATNLALSGLLLFWPSWFARRYLRLRGLDPLTVTMIVGLPIQAMRLYGGPFFLIQDGLFDDAYQFALCMGNVQTLCQTLSLVVFYKIFKHARVDRSLPASSRLGPRALRRASIFFLIAAVVFFYLLASAEFGVANWLSNPRTGYQFYRLGQGHWYALTITSLSTSFLLRFLARPAPRSILAWGTGYMALTLVLGSKGVTLAFFTALLVFVWFTGWHHLSRVFVIGAPVLFALMLGNLYLAVVEEFDATTVLEYFDYYKNAADYYRGVMIGDVQLYGGEVALSSLWAYVPRAIWPEKPVVYGILLVNEIFFPGQAELTNTPDFGGAVEQYADFGVAGVVAFSLFSARSILLALLCYLIFKRPGIRLNHVTMTTFALLLVQFAPMFGAYFPGLLFGVLLAIVLALTALLRGIPRPRHAPRSVSHGSVAS